MVSTRVPKRNGNERPKRERRASTKFEDESSSKVPPSRELKNKRGKNEAVTSKKQIETNPASNDQKTTKKKDHHQQQQRQTPNEVAKVVVPKAKAATTVKNKISSPKNTQQTAGNIEAPKTEYDSESSIAFVSKDVRVRVRLEKKLNKGYRFARLDSSSSNIKNDKAQKKHAVTKRSKSTVNDVGGGGARDGLIRVRVSLERDVRVQIRVETKLMKGDLYARVNDDNMSEDGAQQQQQQQQLVAVKTKKLPKITLRVSQKNTDGSKNNNDDVAANQKKRAQNSKETDEDVSDEEDEGSDTEQSPPSKKPKISQFGNDIHPKRICIVDGCEKYKKARCGGHCLLHYEALSDAEKADIVQENELKKLKVAPEKKRCKVKGCTKYWKAKHDGFCLTCYREHYDGKKELSDEHDKDITDMMAEDESSSAPLIACDEMAGAAATTAGSGPKSTKHCIFEGCMKYKQKGCVGYCLTHKEYADPEQRRLQNEIAAAESAVKKQTTNKSSLCKIEGCDKYKQANCNGYCLQHVKSKKAYDDDDLEDVTKVRVRCDTRLQNGFCVAILSAENRTRLGLERPPQMSDEYETSDDDDDVEAEQGEEPPSAVAKAGQPDFQPDFKVSNVIRRKENGALMCKAVGCPKIAQTKDDGFCRNHYNRYMISTGRCESWNCKCGEKIAITSLRCGKCHRWKDGHHPAYTSSPQKSPAASSYAATSQPRTYVPDDAKVEISDVILKNERGRPLCKVIGCGKAEQSHNDGFCRTHFNEFAILTDGAEEEASEKWTCECGEEWSIRQKRCGNSSCQKWQGGKRESYSVVKNYGISKDNIIEDSKWTCDNCGEEVEMRKSRCGSCHRWRGGKRQGGWTLGSASNYDSDDGGIDRTQDWTCDNCNNGEVISASQTRCGKCNRWRGGKRKPAAWECSKCNLSNPGGKRRCAGCLAWKGMTKKASENEKPASKPAASTKAPSSSKKPEAAKAPAPVVYQPLQMPKAAQQVSDQLIPNFGTIDFTKLSYVNYDFNQSYYESSDYSYLNGEHRGEEG